MPCFEPQEPIRECEAFVSTSKAGAGQSQVGNSIQKASIPHQPTDLQNSSCRHLT
ncbi:hypothetical protein Nmel_016448 [Mimus melanotis]